MENCECLEQFSFSDSNRQKEKFNIIILYTPELEFDLDVIEWNQSGEFRAEGRASIQNVWAKS